MKSIRLSLLIFLGAAFAMSLNSCKKKGDELDPFNKVRTAENFKSMIENPLNFNENLGCAQILDVRSSADYNAGHIPNARNIEATAGNTAGNNSDFKQQVIALGFDKSKPIFVYGKRGDTVHDYVAPARVSESFGKDRTYLLLGGFEDWKKINP